MIIGVPKEIKENENRVGLTPSGAHSLIEKGHTVFIEKNAGDGSGFSDMDYIEEGAKIIDSAAEIYDKSEMIIKVKEPIEAEYNLLKEGQILFTYLHLAANKELTEILMKRKISTVAYETVELDNGSLPLLIPMSEIAGKMAIQLGATFLEKQNGGRGVLLGGVPGTLPATVVIIGGGTVGVNAAKVALGMGADVRILNRNLERLRELDNIFSSKLKTLASNTFNIKQQVKEADLLVGAVLITGAKAPKVVTEEMVKTMKKGSVIVDIAIDQGGSIETMDKITTHKNPTYEKHGVVHYAVTNVPGAVPRTSTMALTNATLPFAIELADKGFQKAVVENPAIEKGVNTYGGKLTYKSVADSLDLEYTDLKSIL